MKSNDLIIPCSWEEREPLFVKSLLYVPPLYDQHQNFSSAEWNAYLNSNSSLVVEYCSGNGQWIIDQAMKHPEKNFIGVDKRFDRVKKIWKKIDVYNLKNLVAVFGDGLTFSQFYLQDQIIDEIYINFPDPWPKRIHGKNRLIKSDFVKEMHRLLKKEGKAILVSDNSPYIEEMKKVFIAEKNWKSAFPPPYHITEWEGYGVSFFETLFRRKNCAIHYLHFIKELFSHDNQP